MEEISKRVVIPRFPFYFHPWEPVLATSTVRIMFAHFAEVLAYLGLVSKQAQSYTSYDYLPPLMASAIINAMPQLLHQYKPKAADSITTAIFQATEHDARERFSGSRSYGHATRRATQPLSHELVDTLGINRYTPRVPIEAAVEAMGSVKGLRLFLCQPKKAMNVLTEYDYLPGLQSSQLCFAFPEEFKHYIPEPDHQGEQAMRWLLHENATRISGIAKIRFSECGT